MKNMKKLTAQSVPPRYTGNHPKRKQLLRLGCAALALALAVGKVPFLRGLASEEEAVSSSDVVSSSDAAVMTVEETVEMKYMGIVIASGSCGENVTYTLDTDGVLTISGSGAMTSRPWGGNREQIKRAIIKNGVTNIVEDAFFQCSALTSVEIPNSVTSIGNQAFYNCSALTSVELPNSVTSIGSYVFYNCSALTSVEIQNSVTSIGNSAFYNCSALTSVEIPDSVTSIGNNAFRQCALTSVTIPDSVTSLGKMAFALCNALNYVTLPKNLSVIPYAGFAQCSSLAKITIGYVTEVGDYAFDSNPLTTVNYPCDHDISDIQSKFPNNPTFVPSHTWEWVTDTEPTCGESGAKHEECTVCHATQSEGTVIDPTGNHTWEWVTDTEPTETDPGEKHEECTVCHAKQNEHTEIPALGVDDYSFTADSAFTWTKGSTDGLKMVIKNTSGDDTTTFDKFKDVYVDGAKLTRDTDYTAEPGSIEITLSATYLEALSTGKHTLKVELTVTTIEHTFTIAAPASTDTPSTGESIAWVVCCAVLMALAACGVGYAVIRRKTVISD